MGCQGEEPVGFASATLFFDTPSGVIGMEGDALVSELDNPLLTGRVNLEGISTAQSSLPVPYDIRLDYGLEARSLLASHPVFHPGIRPPDEPEPDPEAGPELSRLWLDDEGGEGPFVAPSVALPARLAADESEHVKFLLGERGGPEPWPTDLADPLMMTLHPQVIVIPVHVHAFVHAGDQLPPFGVGSMLPLDIDMVRNWLDPSPVVERQASLFDTGGGVWEAITLMDRFQEMHMSPDPIWSQCGIQFRLASFETIDTTESELAFSLAQSGECIESGADMCNLGPWFRFTPHVEAVQEVPGLHIFLGGSIAGECLGGAGTTIVHATTCQSRCRFAGGFNPPYFMLVALDDTLALPQQSRIRVLAHELGHMLTLGHEDTSSCTSGGFEGENLMYSAPLVEGTMLTAEQCEVARTAALRYLANWGLPIGPEWGDVYAP